MNSKQRKQANKSLKKAKRKGTSTSISVTTTHTERTHYTMRAGVGVYEVISGHLKGNVATHPGSDHQVRPSGQLIVEVLKGSDQQQVDSLEPEEVKNEIRGAFEAIDKLQRTDIIRVPHHGSRALQKDEPVEPPRIAEYLAWLLPRNHRNALVGDLLEHYPKVRSKFSKRKADFWAYMQVITSVGALITTLISKLRRSTK